MLPRFFMYMLFCVFSLSLRSWAYGKRQVYAVISIEDQGTRKFFFPKKSTKMRVYQGKGRSSRKKHKLAGRRALPGGGAELRWRLDRDNYAHLKPGKVRLDMIAESLRELEEETGIKLLEPKYLATIQPYFSIEKRDRRDLVFFIMFHVGDKKALFEDLTANFRQLEEFVQGTPQKNLAIVDEELAFSRDLSDFMTLAEIQEDLDQEADMRDWYVWYFSKIASKKENLDSIFANCA